MTPRPFHAIEADLSPRTLLLEASAGTGKTWSLTTIATRLVVEGHVEQVERLLMVTFTNAATQELRERLGDRLREARRVLGGGDPQGDAYLETLVERADVAEAEARVAAALRDLDLVRISTIHGFCARILQDTAFEAGLAFETDDTEDSALLRETALADAWRAVVQGGPPWRAAWLDAQGHHFSQSVKDFGLYLRTRHARHHPRVDPLEKIDLEIDAAWKGFLGDVDHLQALAAFLEEDVTRTKASNAWRLDALRRRLLDGNFTADSESWVELIDVLPSRGGFKSASLKKSAHWPAVLDALAPLDLALADAYSALRIEVLREAVRRFDRIKRAANVRDFDDMIAEVRHRLDDPEGGAALVQRVQDAIDVALIDEFQDTDLDQWTIFSRFFCGKRLILVGDPKQAIYGFRGADVFAYIAARERADDVATLPRNHRSHPELVEAVNHLFVEPGAFVLDALDPSRVDPAKTAAQRALTGDPGPAMQLEFLGADAVREAFAARHGGDPAEATTNSEAYREAAATRTAQTVQHMLRRGITIDGEVLDAGKIAVLTRKHFESRRVHAALREAGIDAVIAGSGDIRDTEVYADVALVLEAVIDPTDRRRLTRALATRFWGAPLSMLSILEHDNEAVQGLLSELEFLRTLWSRRGVFEVLARLVVDRAVERRWLEESDGERDVTDLRHVLEFVHSLEHERGLGPEALVRALWDQRDGERPELELDVTRLRLERDEQAVKIVTVHASKGLEFDVVIVPFAWDSMLAKSPWLHHEGTELVVDWSDDKDFSRDFSRRARAESLAEDMRLLYVALTRASRRCVVFDSDHVPYQNKKKQLSSLHFLLHRTPRASEPIEAWIHRLAEENVARSAERRARLEDLASLEGFGWLDTTTPGRDPRPEDGRDVELRARAVPRGVRDALVPWTVTSFTALARGVHDVEPRLSERDDPEARVVRTDVAPDGIFAFARGARAGNCLHEVLEVSPFDAAPHDDAHRERLEAVLRRHDLFDSARHEAGIDPLEVVAQLVARVGRETFPGAGAPFASIGAKQRLNEWEFRLPVDRIDLRTLADAVEEHAPRGIARPFAERLRSHRDPQDDGLFGGVIDLVFEHDGQYRIVDWKSNHLGNAVDAYDHAAMHAAMLEHDYYLQMLLYQVVVHRHLCVRLRDYEYDRHCAGAAYAFLRGLCGREDRGWIRWRPERALIDTVDACFTRAGIGGAR